MSARVKLENFTEAEITGLATPLAVRLQAVRYLAGAPIHITSGLRSGDTGAHGEGLAVDISDNNQGNPLSSRWRFNVLRAAFLVGFNRIGVYDRHIHLDISQSLPQEVAWWATSD